MDINPTSFGLVLISLAALVMALCLFSAAIALWAIKLALFGVEASALCVLTFWAAHYVAVHQTEVKHG